MSRVPDIPMEVVEWLQKYNPQRVIGLHESFEAAHRRAGFQDCIDKLYFFASLQLRTDLSDTEKAFLEEIRDEDADEGEAP